eukprot:6192508-Pleurochrysis_carterae.AAC.1
MASFDGVIQVRMRAGLCAVFERKLAFKQVETCVPRRMGDVENSVWREQAIQSPRNTSIEHKRARAEREGSVTDSSGGTFQPDGQKGAAAMPWSACAIRKSCMGGAPSARLAARTAIELGAVRQRVDEVARASASLHRRLHEQGRPSTGVGRLTPGPNPGLKPDLTF